MCHSEQSEESEYICIQILHFVQNDTLFYLTTFFDIK